MRRRSQVRLVAHAPGGVVANAARGEVGTEVAGEVAGADVVGGNHERWAPRQRIRVVEKRGDQIRAHRRRRRRFDSGLTASKRSAERSVALVVAGDLEKRAKRQGRPSLETGLLLDG